MFYRKGREERKEKARVFRGRYRGEQERTHPQPLPFDQGIGWITCEQGGERVLDTQRTFLNGAPLGFG